MAIIWEDERMTPEHMLKLLQEQREHWLEAAAAFERLKNYLTGTFSLQDADGQANVCRMRAEKLQMMIYDLLMQCESERSAAAKEERRQPYLQ